jgi:hypothetical protein
MNIKIIKTLVIFFAFVLTITPILLTYLQINLILWCNGPGIGEACVRYEEFFASAPPVFLFSLLIYFVYNRIFLVWLTMTIVWYPISTYLIMYASHSGTSIGPSGDAIIWLFSIIIYSSLSLLIIIIGSLVEYLQLRRLKNK